MYKNNDIVVYRRTVCRVIDRTRSSINGEVCYLLVPYHQQDGSVKIQVPVSNRAGHLRDLSTKEEIEALLKETPSISVIPEQTGNMRARYVALLKTDDLKDLVRIIKTTSLRNERRKLKSRQSAFIDSMYQKKAEQYLYNEAGMALNVSYDQAKKYFESELGQSEVPGE